LTPPPLVSAQVCSLAAATAIIPCRFEAAVVATVDDAEETGFVYVVPSFGMPPGEARINTQAHKVNLRNRLLRNMAFPPFVTDTLFDI
jgi:hypothetical protein